MCVAFSCFRGKTGKFGSPKLKLFVPMILAAAAVESFLAEPQRPGLDYTLALGPVP
jgi:hypothetical protein